MIRYGLKCGQGHTFESWFQSSSAYDKLAAAGLVECAVCGDTSVEKTLMAPRVTTSRNRSKEAAPQPEAQSPAPTPDLSAPSSAAEQAVAEMRKHIEKNATYVGGNFAKEARDQHDGLTEGRAIYGEATAADAKKLIEDGIPVAPLPFTPKRKSN